MTVMKILMVSMKVPEEKCLELSQAVSSLVPLIKIERGCIECRFFKGVENETEFMLIEEWCSGEDLKRHLRKNSFKILKGALKLLEDQYSMHLLTVAAPRKASNV